LDGIINISQFINHLKKEGLIIVSKADYEQKINFTSTRLRDLQKKYLSKEYLTFKQILEAKLLPITSRQSINNWIDKGIFLDGEAFRGSDGKMKIITSAIVRIRHLKNL